MNELKINKDRVLAAADKCSTAKTVLKELFPEVFEEDKYVDLRNCYSKSNNRNAIELYDKQGYVLLATRTRGSYAYRGFILSNNYNWEIVEDDIGANVLIPTKK